jgi:chaperonin GroEL
MANIILSGDLARQRVLEGIEVVYNALKVTYGPKGGDVIIERNFGAPSVTHDGVTVADSIDFRDDDSNRGTRAAIKFMQAASHKLNIEDGDGTTGVAILTRSIARAMYKLEVAGYNAQDLKTGIKIAGDYVIDRLNDITEPLDDKSPKVRGIAIISASDKAIGNLVADVMTKVGKDGVVTVEAGQTSETTAEITKGYSFDRGFLSPLFITNEDSQECVLENPTIVLATSNIDSTQDVMPILQDAAKSHKPLLFIVDELSDKMLDLFILNRSLGIAVIKSPSWGDDRKHTMEDLKVLLGATSVTDVLSTGGANKVIISKSKTSIIHGNGKAKDVASRIKLLSSQAKAETISTEKDKIKRRIAQLNGRVAIVRVGGDSETEISKKKDDVDDAVCAVKSALVNGFVAGGGSIFVALSTMIEPNAHNIAIQMGQQIVKDSLLQPFIQLMDNSGMNGEVILEAVKKYPTGYGVNLFDVDAGIVDLKADGVIDSTKVIQDIIRVAVSIASTAMTVGNLVVNVPDNQ